MRAAFQFAHRLEFSAEAESADDVLRSIPATPGVFALRADDRSEPYLTRAADLRRRIRRMLAPPEARNEDGTPVLSKRLNLRDRVRFIEYTLTGSEFESLLTLYHATRAAFGAEQARKRLRLYTPYMLRVTMQHEHPRVYATNRLSRKSLAESFGPFPSRAAAERYCDAVLDLFQLRRCHEDLQPYPEHPGCVYGEMKKCMEPCKAGAPQGCSREEMEAQYRAEAGRMRDFFATRGESMLAPIAADREAASEAMDFERAAALHKQWEKVRAAALLADELVRPVADLRTVVIQRSADEGADAALNAAVFLLANGHLCGPEPLSTLGVRAVREQTAVGSSLFAQPLMLAAVPLDEAVGEDAPTAALSPEDRARNVLAALEAETVESAPTDEFCDALSLFRRWYYRPEKQRAGEVFVPSADGGWPVRRILNGAARVVLGTPGQVAPVDREAFKDMKTKVLHEGREGVERVVPVLPKRTRKRKSVTPADVIEES